MTFIPQIAAQMLRVGRRTIAEAINAVLDDSLPGGDLELLFASDARRVDQLETHVHILTACVEFTSPLLLDDYVRWAANLPAKISPFHVDISDFFDELQRFVAAEFPSEVAGVIRNYVDRALVSLQHPFAAQLVQPPQNPNDGLQRRYLQLLLEKRRDEATRLVLTAVEAGIDIQSIYLDVIQPSQHEIGRLWQAGTIDVAEEHYCTAATQFIMCQLQPYFVAENPTGQTVVATCVGDELHEVGLRIVADLFEISGWNAIYLGANAPAVSIANTLVSSDAQVLAISTTMTQHLFGLAEVIRVVRAHPGCENVKVLVGGYPFNIDPFLWKRVGADADAADGKDAVRAAHRLINLSHREPSVIHHPTPRIVKDPSPAVFGDSHDDLSRMNNNLITLQRELNKANVQLSASNKANQEKAEALQQADRRKDEFLAMLAHELRGPLAPIELAVALLQMDDLQPSVIEEARHTMKRQLQQMKHLISDLLDASRVVHGKIQLNRQRLQVADVVHRAVEIVHPLIQNKRQQLTLDLCEESLTIDADEIRLSQVLANLLTNASKYNDERGKITLKTRRHRDRAVVEVIDNGIGIEPQLLPEMFSAFAQEQRAKKHSMGGLGLGLSLVKQLVELHDGTVKAESEGVDRGSRFIVSLPTVEPPGAPVPSSTDETEDTTASPCPSRRVLVVEDSAGIARITAIFFEKLGHTTEVALNGASAIQKYQKSRPDIVVLDLNLPDISGLDVTKAIRQIDSASQTLIVALTGHDDDRLMGTHLFDPHQFQSIT